MTRQLMYGLGMHLFYKTCIPKFSGFPACENVQEKQKKYVKHLIENIKNER